MSERIPSLPIYQPNRQLSSLKKHTDLSDVISSKPTDYLHFYFTLKSQQTVLLGILKSIDEHATLFEGKALCKNNSIKNISIKNLDINDVKNSHQNNGNSDNINNTNDLNSTHSPKKHPTTISLPSMKKENEFSINQIKDYLNSFINCSYGELYIISAATINLLQPIIRNPNYSPQVQKFALHFLNSVLAITRMLQSIQNEYQKPPQSQHNSLLLHDINLNDSNDAINNINMDGLSDNSDNNNNLYSDNSCQNSDKNNQKYNDVIVCRICDENVPLELFEEHTKSCIEAYKTEEKIQNIQKEMNAAQNIICENFLREGWPGEQNKALESILPMLRVSLLLERAHQIDPKNTDSIDELEYIVTALTHLNMKLISEKSSSEIVSKVKDIVQQKLKTTTIIRHTSEVLQNTRVSGNAGTEKIAQIQISDFDFIKRISAGAFARVFLAKKKVSNDIYAIKVLPKDDVVQKNQVKRVVLEKDILLSFNNPYIINFYYSISGNKNLYLVMEYLPGGDLYSLLQNLGTLDEEVARVYTFQIAIALSYLHSHGIIHRDIKPDNILVDAEGFLKLTDFGLSYIGMVDRKKAKDDKVVESSSMVGTPDYIAPEIVESKAHSFTVDWWSLGVMLYEFLYGEPPFHADSEKQIYDNIVNCNYSFPTRPDTVNQSSSSASNATGDINSEDEEEDDGFIEISEEAKDLIRGLLTLDPEKRLGAKSSDEILHHPWFKGLDPQNLKSPFVPELASDQDTTYFTTRYEFNREDDSDIIADIQDSKIEQKPLNKRSRSVTASALLLTPFLLVLDQSSSFSSPRNSLDYPGNLKFPSSSFSSPKNSPDISVDSESDDISAFPSISQQHLENAFPSISITQLQNKNFQVLRRMSKTRTSLDNINPSRSFAVLSRDSLMPVPKKRTRKSSCFLPSDDMILPAKKLNVV